MATSAPPRQYLQQQQQQQQRHVAQRPSPVQPAQHSSPRASHSNQAHHSSAEVVSAAAAAAAYTTPPNSHGASSHSSGFLQQQQQQQQQAQSHKYPPPYQPHSQTSSPHSPQTLQQAWQQQQGYYHAHGQPQPASSSTAQHDLPSLPLASRQARPNKAPLYIPAALRPTDRPGSRSNSSTAIPQYKHTTPQPFTPPQSAHGSSDSLDHGSSKLGFHRYTAGTSPPSASLRASSHSHIITSSIDENTAQDALSFTADTPSAAYLSPPDHPASPASHTPANEHTNTTWTSNSILELVPQSSLSLAFSPSSFPAILGPPTRAHWRPDSASFTCSYPGCARLFPRSLFQHALTPFTFSATSPFSIGTSGGTAVERRHHCRRCGGVFCQDHSRFLAPLDQHAEFNPRVPRQGMTRCCAGCKVEFVRWIEARVAAVGVAARSGGQAGGGARIATGALESRDAGQDGGNDGDETMTGTHAEHVAGRDAEMSDVTIAPAADASARGTIAAPGKTHETRESQGQGQGQGQGHGPVQGQGQGQGQGQALGAVMSYGHGEGEWSTF